MQENAVVRHFRAIFRVLQTHSKMMERSSGLSTAQLWMLHAIAASPGIKVSELAAILVIHRSTCSNMLDKLERKALIYRERRKIDQRTVHLFTTQQGSDLLLQTPSPPQEILTLSLSNLSQKQLTNLEKSLEDVISSLEEENEKIKSFDFLANKQK